MDRTDFVALMIVMWGIFIGLLYKVKDMSIWTVGGIILIFGFLILGGIFLLITLVAFDEVA